MEITTSANPVKLLRISIRVLGWDGYWWGSHRHHEGWHRCATPELKSEPND